MAFPVTTPEAVGVSSGGILRFLGDMREQHLHLHSLLILRHGQELARCAFAPWNAEDRHMLFSLSKSFTSTAVGFAVQDGLLTVEDRLVDFFPELLPSPPCENTQKMRIRHLLTMNTGHEIEPMRTGSSWEETFLRTYVPREPGTHFLYNTFATYMLSAVLQKVTGRKLLSYLREKLMDPLGMSPDIWFEESPSGVATGGYGLNVRIDDIAKLGQFYLQGGKWEGRQLLNEKWIRDAQTPWSDNSHIREGVTDWNVGYGYQFWMCRPEKVFRGDGAYGQYCVILPEQDMVIAITGGLKDMQAVLQSIWDRVLPTVDQPQSVDAAEDLRAALAAPVTPAFWEEEGLAVVTAPAIDPAWLGTYRFQYSDMGIERLAVTEDGLSLTRKGYTARLPLSPDVWQRVRLSAVPEPEASAHDFFAIASLRAARQEDELLLHFCFTETPFENMIRIRFLPHGLTFRLKVNIGADADGELIAIRE
ncbi:MAG: serine hydrolase [Clostridia bacterium]|nr:serine hydrolase [Clostridia bacterium]